MLLDVYILKKGLLELPVLNTDPPAQPSALYDSSTIIGIDCRYVKFVNKTIAKIETILKVILTAKDPPAGLVQNYFFLIADKSVTNFLKVLELKVTTPSNSFPAVLPSLSMLSLNYTNPRESAKQNKIPSWNSSTAQCPP